LVACSLYVDEPTANFKQDCKAAIAQFALEFNIPFIRLLFNNAIISTQLDRANTELSIQNGQSVPFHNNPGEASIAALQKIYREGNLHATNVTAATPIRPSSKTAGQILVPLKREGGTFTVPVLINKAIPLNFVVDSGADDVSVPSDVVLTLIRTGTLQDSDFIGTQTYKLADGSTAPSRTFRIRSLTVNNVEIGNVKASVAPAAGELLLGQSFLSRFKSWSIDNAKQALVLTQ
jgi:predicted aspartyl protease